jgi:hypothetical protein
MSQVFDRATGKWKERAPQSKGMKGVIDDIQRKFNPTDEKVKKALKDAGLTELKKKQDKLAGITRRT